VDGHRPSGTVLLRSLAQSYGSRAAGLVLTGMGRGRRRRRRRHRRRPRPGDRRRAATAMLASMPGEALSRCSRAMREEAES
jgi:two-component system chemotaxis response regulator CheB